jgi:hypothetical protein
LSGAEMIGAPQQSRCLGLGASGGARRDGIVAAFGRLMDDAEDVALPHLPEVGDGHESADVDHRVQSQRRTIRRRRRDRILIGRQGRPGGGAASCRGRSRQAREKVPARNHGLTVSESRIASTVADSIDAADRFPGAGRSHGAANSSYDAHDAETRLAGGRLSGLRQRSSEWLWTKLWYPSYAIRSDLRLRAA